MITWTIIIGATSCFFNRSKELPITFDFPTEAYSVLMFVGLFSSYHLFCQGLPERR